LGTISKPAYICSLSFIPLDERKAFVLYKLNIMKYIQTLGLALLFFAACSNPTETPDTPRRSGIPELDAIEDKVNAQPNDTALQTLRFKVLINLEKYKDAVQNAELLIRLDSTQERFYRFLAEAYFEDNQSKPALQTLELAVQKFPKNTYLILSLAEMNLIVKEYDKGLVILDKALQLSPYDARAYFIKGQIFKEKGDTIQALAAFQTVTQQDPDNLDAYLQLAELCEKQNKPIALDYYANALAIDSSNETALLGKAQYYHQRGQLDKAAVIYEACIVAHPLLAEAPYNLGLLLLEQADKAKSKELYEKAFKRFDLATKNELQFGEAYYYKGLVSEKLGNLDAAKRDYQNAINMGEKLGFAKSALDKLNGSDRLPAKPRMSPL
jgi:tetratricopeptide (TPR) repeat protein